MDIIFIALNFKFTKVNTWSWFAWAVLFFFNRRLRGTRRRFFSHASIGRLTDVSWEASKRARALTTTRESAVISPPLFFSLLCACDIHRRFYLQERKCAAFVRALWAFIMEIPRRERKRERGENILRSHRRHLIFEGVGLSHSRVNSTDYFFFFSFDAGILIVAVMAYSILRTIGDQRTRGW